MMTGGEPLSYSLTFSDVVDIVRLLDESTGAITIQIQGDGIRLRIERGGHPGGELPAATPVATPAPVLVETTVEAGDAVGLVTRAPIAGVFFRAPQPGADPFVSVGDEVDEDTVIGIIEVMKLMNNVRAGVSGRVTAVCADDAQLVEYDQPLLRVVAASVVSQVVVS